MLRCCAVALLRQLAVKNVYATSVHTMTFLPPPVARTLTSAIRAAYSDKNRLLLPLNGLGVFRGISRLETG